VFNLFLTTGECDIENEIICAPADVLELFEAHHVFFAIGGFDVTRTVLLMWLAIFIVLAFLWAGLRGQRSVVPTKMGLIVNDTVNFVKNDIAKGVIGPEGQKYVPYLLTMFLLVLVGDWFEVIPGINFPITSRMALPLFFSVVTWVMFVFIGFKKHGFKHYFIDTIWPKAVPIALRPLVGLIELVSVFMLRPITLAVRLFANLVAGHLMLTLLLVSGYTFIISVGDVVWWKHGVGLGWYVLGLGIWLFEVLVGFLQAYIITLLSAVYIESSINPAH
jgi:F-type H+-transporting ATPase subunit a